MKRDASEKRRERRGAATSHWIMRAGVSVLGIDRRALERLAPGAVVRGLPTARGGLSGFESFSLEWLFADPDSGRAALVDFVEALYDAPTLLAFRFDATSTAAGGDRSCSSVGVRKPDGEWFIMAVPWAVSGASRCG